MSDTVTLKHVVNRQPVRGIHFYDGYEEARDGLVTIPLHLENRIKRVWRLGYNQSPNGRRLPFLADVLTEIERQTAESAKEDNEGSDRRRQSNSTNRVRTSKR